MVINKKEIGAKTPQEFKSMPKEKANNLIMYLAGKREMNTYGHIRLEGKYITDWFLELADEHKFGKFLIRISRKLSHANHIKMDVNKVCHSWKELYDTLKVSTRDRKAFREFCTDFNILKISSGVVTVNPTLIKKGIYCTPLSISLFKENTIHKISYYSAIYLFVNGFIFRKDLEDTGLFCKATIKELIDAEMRLQEELGETEESSINVRD